MIQRNDLLPQIEGVFLKYNAKEEIKLLHLRDETNQDKDVWNDTLVFVDQNKNVWLSKGTTDPGSNAYQRHPEGAAHMMLGYHNQIWVIDIHAANNMLFRHEALCSRPARGCNPISFYRDVDKNRIYSTKDIVLKDFVGINCHRASKIKEVFTIGDYSDGCQVRQNVNDHVFMMKEIKKFDCVRNSSIKGIYTYKFSCLLIPINEFKF